jgi:signal transduction histidine kinase
MGISQENIDKLFKDFSMLKQHQDVNHTGTGLGLSICKNIVNQMGGEIHVQSEEEQGSKFIVTLQAKTTDKMVICNEAQNMTNDQKIDYLRELGAFNYA